MGGASFIAIINGVIKGKVAALILGPAGIGIIALLQSIMNTSMTFAGMGLSTSGVQQIAVSKENGFTEDMAYTRKALYYASCLFGLVGALVLIMLSKPVSHAVFGNLDNVRSIALLSIGVWATIYSGAQTAFLNGLHRVKDLARINILSTLFSMLISVVAIFQLRESGLFLVVISMPVTSLATSWWISRKVDLPAVTFRWDHIAGPLRKLMSLGSVFMLTSFMAVGTHFLVRVIITQKLGIGTTGHFQAAWNISMFYLGFVFTTMGADYYPRISAAANDTDKIRGLVNDQAEVALLLTGPLIVGMLTFSPFVIKLLYSSAFKESVAILRWQLLGDVFRITGWSMGYILLRQRYGRIFFFSELLYNVIYFSIIWFGVDVWGFEVTGFAFFIAYACNSFFVFLIVRNSMNFYWNREVLYQFMLITVCAGVVFFIGRSYMGLMFVSYIITAFIIIYSILKLSSLADRSLSLGKMFKHS